MYKILIVEDDADLLNILNLYLSNNDFEIEIATDGISAMNILRSKRIDALVTDIMLPKLDGYTLIRKIRQASDIPIIVISAKTDLSDRLFGLQLGADIYLTKPINPIELIEYIKILMRRSSHEAEDYPSTITYSDCILDCEAQILRKNGKSIQLTAAEYRLMKLFLSHPKQIFTKKQLYTAISKDDTGFSDNTVMVHLSHLRKKIDDPSLHSSHIVTIKGMGYRFE